MESGATTIRVTGGDLTDVVFVGRGGHATVYRARQTSLGRNVAVKVLDSTATDDGSLPAEARIQASMSWHANVLTLLGSTKVDDGRTALLLEYAPGGSLQEKIQRTGPLPPAEWRQLGAELASALAAAHDAKVLHRDVKPSNVLLAADGSARLADFGLAGPVEDTLRQWAGSVAYSPPELLEGTPADTPNDVYSLVLTLLFAATGKMPFDADKAQPAAVMARIQSERVRFTDKVEGVDPQLAALLDAALDHEPSDRPSARALAGALERRGRVGPIDLRESYLSTCQGRLRVFEAVAADIEQADSPTEVVERLLVGFPAEWAHAVAPFLQDASLVTGRPLVATDRQLAAHGTADVLRALAGADQWSFDGQTGAFDPTAAPAAVSEPAAVCSAAFELGASLVGDDRINLQPAKQRMYAAIQARLTQPGFLDQFFEDPRSLDVFDVDVVMLMVQVARPLGEMLLDGHWDWVMDVFARSPEIRSTLSLEAPDFILRVGNAEPDRFAADMTPDWSDELRAGYESLGSATRAGIEALYPEQLRVAGLGSPCTLEQRDRVGPIDLRESFLSTCRGRLQVFEAVAADIEQAESPTEAVEHLLVRFPAEWAHAVAPFLQDASLVTGRPLVATDRQLAATVTADVLRALAGAEQWVFDGQTGAFDPGAAPAAVREPAAVCSAAFELGASVVGDDRIDLLPAKQRMYAAIQARLTQPGFLDQFFEDPRSLEVLDVDTMMLMVQVARPFAEALLDGHWDWAMNLFARSPEIRSTLSLEAPDFILRVGNAEPDRFAADMTPDWSDELRAGYESLGSATRAGIEALYPEQLRVAGLRP